MPLSKIIGQVNPVLRGWANYHREGNNTGLFRDLDKWIRNRVRAYKRRCWRDRGRWKIYEAEELDWMGLVRTERMLAKVSQLKLFESPY